MGTYTKRAGDLTLVARCDDAFARQAESLLDIVARFRGQGKGLADGVTVQFGFSRLTLRQRDTELVVCEPDYGRDPLAGTREDLTRTLGVVLGQAAVVNRLGVEPADVRFDQRVLVARGRLGERRVYLHRREPADDDDSGWYVGPADPPAPEDRAGNFASPRVFELLYHRPSLLRAMALPTGFLAVFDGDRIEAVLDPTDRDVWKATAGGHDMEKGRADD